MTEEELTKTAWEIFNNVLEDIEFPSYVYVSKHDDNSVTFILILSDGKSGFGTFYYKPNIEIVKDTIKFWSEKNEKLIGKKLAEEFTFSIAECYVFGLLTNFHIDILETFQNFSELSLLLLTQLPAKAFSLSYRRTPNDMKDIVENSKKQFDEFFDERNKSLKKRLLRQLESGNNYRKPAKHLIAHFYSLYLPDWNEAKRFYKKNKNYDNWEKMLLLAFPKLPLDLISRLTNSDPYDSMPSSISLEHAARACGIENNSVGLRTLQQYLKDSRDWIEKNGEEAKEKEVAKYVNWAIDDIVATYRVADSIGKEPNFDDFPLIHQTLNEIIKEPIIKLLNENNENES